MQVGVIIPSAGPKTSVDNIVATARLAAELGYHSLWLTDHVVLAALILPLAFVTLLRALRGRFADHAAIARWTLPLWFYVSVTGVVIYWMLYRM